MTEYITHLLVFGGPEIVHVDDEEDGKEEEGEVMNPLATAHRVQLLREHADHVQLYHHGYVQPDSEVGEEAEQHMVDLT